MKKCQKNIQESEDQFQLIKDQILTIPQPNYSPPKNITKSNPRIQIMNQKQKVGLILQPLQPTQTQVQPTLKTKQVQQIKGKVIKVGSAVFRSNFQCGSLGTVKLIGVNSFLISMDNQSNSDRGNTWFYFIVQGLKGQAHFTITGFKKRASLYNQGMKMCYRDQKQSDQWKRGGLNHTYARKNDDQEISNIYQTKFSFNFKNSSCIEFAYCFPYGIARLNNLISQLKSMVRTQNLATSFDGRDLPILNIGCLKSKDVIIVSARVHPGQTVSSFIMEGFLKQLTSDSQYAQFLRSKFLFKVMPMINVDGVARGNFRFSATGVDLNRRWKEPVEEHHPQIYYLKKMMLSQNSQKRVRMFIDLHGHSRKKNIFFYGCCKQTHNLQDNFYPKAFPYLMSKIHNAYSYQDCSFIIQEEKQGTARVSLWKQLKINQIYTLEASFCSSSKGSNYLDADYQKMGAKLCEGMALYFCQNNQNQYPQLQQALLVKEQAYRELKSDHSLLKLGNEDNCGSQSQPQKGQSQSGFFVQNRDQKQIQQKIIKPVRKLDPINCDPLKQRTSVTSNLKRKSMAQTKMQQSDIDQKNFIQDLIEENNLRFSKGIASQPKRQKIEVHQSSCVKKRNVRVHSVRKQPTIHHQQTQQTIKDLQQKCDKAQLYFKNAIKQKTQKKSQNKKILQTNNNKETSLLSYHFQAIKPRMAIRTPATFKRQSISEDNRNDKGSFPMKMSFIKGNKIVFQ